MTSIAYTTPTDESPNNSEICYNRHSHMFDVIVSGEKIDEVACYGDGEGSILIYLALREAEEAQVDAAYHRTQAARYVLTTYPRACYIGWRDAFQIVAPIFHPQIIVTRPNGYTVHANLNAGLGAVVDVVTF